MVSQANALYPSRHSRFSLIHQHLVLLFHCPAFSPTCHSRFYNSLINVMLEHDGYFLVTILKTVTIADLRCRSFRCSRRVDGQVILSKVPGCLHAQVIATPPHRRSLLRHGLPTHALHGARRVPTKETAQPVHPEVQLQ